MGEGTHRGRRLVAALAAVGLVAGALAAVSAVAAPSAAALGNGLAKTLIRISRLLLLLLLFVAAAATGSLARAQASGESSHTVQERTWGDSSVPLVYKAQDTGANYSDPVFPSFDQLPIIRPLPDPFRFFDGGHSTAFANWEHRRSEIMASIEKYEIGPVPDCSDCSIHSSYAPGANGGTLIVNVTRNGRTITLTSHVYLPSGSGPFPALIAMSTRRSTGPNTGSLPPSIFTGRDIATVDFPINDVSTYAGGRQIDHSADPFYQLYPQLCAGTCDGTVSNSGQYAAWTWGVSRIIDGLEIVAHQAVDPLPVDLSHLAVTGCSFAGKMALFAGAFDERVALTIAQENGGGGAPSWRVSQEIEPSGSVEHIDNTDYSWFGSQMKQFAGDKVYKLPDDHDELMDLVAPRALLETGNTDYYWLSNRSNYISARATQKVYNTFGIGDRFGFYIDGDHLHCSTLPAESPAIAGFVDKFMLGKADADTNVQVNPYPTLDYARWTSWWGRGDRAPAFPNNWNPGDASVAASSPGAQAVNAGDPVLAGYDVSMPGNHPAATVSVQGANVQTDVTCPDGSSSTLTIPLPDQTYSIPANSQSWIPSANPNSALVYQGSATAAVCRGGIAKDAYFSALGVASIVGDPPQAPGIQTTDTADPIKIRFHYRSGGAGGGWSPAVSVELHSP